MNRMLQEEKEIMCPRCGYQHALPQQPCPRCGFTLTSLPVQREPAVAIHTHGEVALAPEMTLQRNHYILVEQQEMWRWSSSIYEARWLAQDSLAGNMVTICEVVSPLSRTTMPLFLSMATKTFLANNDHPNLTKLLDVFMEHGRHFFVFEQPTGDSLQTRVQRGYLLQEAEAITCYAQMANALRFLAQRQPPLVHGAVQPDHIIHVQSRWILTNASVLIAGGAAQLFSNANAVPETITGFLTPAADLYALTAVMYYAVTGVIPSQNREIQQSQLQRASISSAFAAILLTGLHPRPQERYHSASEIEEALRGLEQRQEEIPLLRGSLEPNGFSNAFTSPSRPTRTDPVPVSQLQPMQPVQSMQLRQPPQSVNQSQLPPAASLELEPSDEADGLLPLPEKLPLFPRQPDSLIALGWTLGILFCASIILLIAR